ncbi:MAG: hypothetical protein ACOC4Z_02905 [Patescibacteria group bacterium]
MRKVIFLIVIPIIVLLQVGVLPAFFGLSSVPNILLALIVSLLFHSHLREALWLSFLGGFLIDFFGTHLFGISALFFVALSILFFRIFRLLGRSLFVFVSFSYVGCFLFRLLLSLPLNELNPLFWGACLDTILVLFSSFLVVPVWENVYQQEEEQLNLKLDV